MKPVYEKNILTVTSVSDYIMLKYGRRTLPTIIENSPGDVLICYDGDPNLPEQDDRVRHLSLNKEKELHKFVDRHKETYSNGFRYNASKFAWKVFSLYEGYKTAINSEHEYLIWCDADIYINDRIRGLEIEEQIEDFDIAWLDRPHFTHGETGLIIFSAQSPWSYHIINWMKNLYVDDSLFMMKEWHDAYAMTFLINSCKKTGMKVNNMNTAKKGTEAIKHSPFKKKMEHIK